VAQFRYLGTTVTNQNLIREEVKRRLNLGNACYHSVQNLLSPLYFSYRLHNLWYKYIPHVSLHYMFRPDGAIFRYIEVLQSPVSLSATLPTVASVYALGVPCMYGMFMLCVEKFIAYWIFKILKY
jgi:hypothetical protein